MDLDVNLLWPTDAIWQHRFGSTLFHVTACPRVMLYDLTAPGHHLNQCWLLICEVLCHSHESNFKESALAAFLYNGFESYTSGEVFGWSDLSTRLSLKLGERVLYLGPFTTFSGIWIEMEICLFLIKCISKCRLQYVTQCRLVWHKALSRNA